MEEISKKYIEITPDMNAIEYDKFKKKVSNPLDFQKLKYIRRDDFDDGNIHVDIYDCKVNVRGPDDKIYCSTKIKRNTKIRDEITRGCILLEIKDHKSGKNIWKIYQGFAKFTGLTDQDDDDVASLSEKGDFSASNAGDVFFHEPRDSARKIVQIEKENGKAGHFGAFKINDVVYMIAGSKNVHVVFRNGQDLAEQKLKGLHTEFGYIFLDILKKLPEGNRFLEMMCETGLLANFEIMLKRDQHIVDYEFNETDSVARFLAFTGRRTYNDQYKMIFGKCIPVDVGIEYMKELGFSVPEYRVHEFTEKEVLKEVIRDVRSGNNSEGSVLYFMSREGRTIGLCKTKTIWYIFFRAIREKLKRKGNTFNQLIKERFRSIQKWLDVSNEEIMRWRIIAYHFHLYVYERLKEIGDAKERVNKLREGYADQVRDFMKEFVMPEDLVSAVSEIKDKKLVWGSSSSLSQQEQQEKNDGWQKVGGKKGKKKNKHSRENYQKQREMKKKKRDEQRRRKKEREEKREGGEK